MREETEEKVVGVRKRRFARTPAADRDERGSTKQLHDRLLRALSDRRDRRFQRSFRPN